MRRISKYTIIAALVLMTVVSLGGCGKRGKRVPESEVAGGDYALAFL